MRAAAVFGSVRGQPPRDIDPLARLLSAVYGLAWATRDRLSEADIYLVLVREAGQGIAIADAMIVRD